MRMLLGFFLLLVQLHVAKGCELNDIKKTSNITAHVGDTVLLPCSCFNLQTKPSNPNWKKNNKDDWNQVLTTKTRFPLSNDRTPGNLSLRISHLTPEDDGLYRCTVTVDEYTDINLIVKGGPVAAEPSLLMGKAFFTSIAVVLLLLGLGGVVFWRYRVAVKKLTPSCDVPSGQKNEEEAQRKKQEMQDDVMYTTVVHTTQEPKAFSTKESTEYAVIKLS